jgi:hypothetical protein
VRTKRFWNDLRQIRSKLKDKLHPRFISIGRKNNENLKGLITWSRRYLRSPQIIISSCHLENSLNVKGHIWNSPLTYNFADSGEGKAQKWKIFVMECSNVTMFHRRNSKTPSTIYQARRQHNNHYTLNVGEFHIWPLTLRLFSRWHELMMICGDLRYLRLHVINPLRFSLFFRPILMNLGCNCLIIFQPCVLLYIWRLWS